MTEYTGEYSGIAEYLASCYDSNGLLQKVHPSTGERREKMKKNKVITILLLSLLASIAAGCGAQSQSVSEAAESVSAPQPSAEAVEPVETDTSVETPESLGSAADSVDEPPLAEVEYPLTDTTETLSVFFSVSPMLA